MLNEKVCRYCCDRFYTVSRLSATGVLWRCGWEAGIVWCPRSVSRTQEQQDIKSCSTSDPPPEWCPYEAEHAVSQDAE